MQQHLFRTRPPQVWEGGTGELGENGPAERPATAWEDKRTSAPPEELPKPLDRPGASVVVPGGPHGAAPSQSGASLNGAHSQNVLRSEQLRKAAGAGSSSAPAPEERARPPPLLPPPEEAPPQRQRTLVRSAGDIGRLNIAPAEPQHQRQEHEHQHHLHRPPRNPIPHAELVKMTKQTPRYRLTLLEEEDWLKARKRARKAGERKKCDLSTIPVLLDDEAHSPKARREKRKEKQRADTILKTSGVESKKKKLSDPTKDENRPEKMITDVRQAGPEHIGLATESVGLELYFLFLKQGSKVMFVWFVSTLPLVLLCLQHSASDEDLAIPFMAKFSLASFGYDNTKDQTDANINFFGFGSVAMVSITPVLSALSALGAFFYWRWLDWFASEMMPAVVKSYTHHTVTPSHFTFQVDYLPSLERMRSQHFEKLTESSSSGVGDGEANEEGGSNSGASSSVASSVSIPSWARLSASSGSSASSSSISSSSSSSSSHKLDVEAELKQHFLKVLNDAKTQRIEIARRHGLIRPEEDETITRKKEEPAPAVSASVEGGSSPLRMEAASPERTEQLPEAGEDSREGLHDSAAPEAANINSESTAIAAPEESSSQNPPPVESIGTSSSQNPKPMEERPLAQQERPPQKKSRGVPLSTFLQEHPSLITSDDPDAVFEQLTFVRDNKMHLRTVLRADKLKQRIIGAIVDRHEYALYAEELAQRDLPYDMGSSSLEAAGARAAEPGGRVAGRTRTRSWASREDEEDEPGGQGRGAGRGAKEAKAKGGGIIQPGGVQQGDGGAGDHPAEDATVVLWGGNRLAYPHRTGVRPVSVQCHAGCT